MYGRYTAGRCASQTTILVVGLIFAFEWWVYHITCTPFWQGAVLFNIFLTLAVWSYLQTAFTDPGTPRCSEWQEWLSVRQQSATEEGQVRRTASSVRDRPRCWRPGEATWCSDCQAERPERAHHCSQCGYCILRMDHHCPWVGTCIGWRNHKYFLLMNWWTFWACLAWLLTARNPSLIEAFAVLTSTSYGPIHISLLPIIGALLTTSFMIITGGMFLYSLSMVCRNVTAIEDLYPGDNPYSFRSYADNARQLLGNLNDPRLLIPVDGQRHTTGWSFPIEPKAQLPAKGAGQSGYGTC